MKRGLPALIYVAVGAMTIGSLADIQPVRAATRTFMVTSTAMAPTLVPGDRVIVNTSPRSIDSGDIIVFRRSPSENCGGSPVSDEVMRIIGLPGDTVEVRNDKVYLGGKILPEPWLPPATNESSPYTAPYGPVTVPAGAYFVMGDNRTRSCDNRMWGPLQRSYIVGVSIDRTPVAGPRTMRAVG